MKMNNEMYEIMKDKRGFIAALDQSGGSSSKTLKAYGIPETAYSTEEEMLRSWKGLGYYRRAKNLRKAAMDVMELYQGKIPLEFEDLKKIKGIGCKSHPPLRYNKALSKPTTPILCYTPSYSSKKSPEALVDRSVLPISSSSEVA
jgi:hypothetical protein